VKLMNIEMIIPRNYACHPERSEGSRYRSLDHHSYKKANGTCARSLTSFGMTVLAYA
jgi:hypothetical protein